MATPEILEKIMSEINDILPASEAGLAEEIEPVIKKYLEYGELKQSPLPFVVKIESARHLGDILMRLEKKHHSFLEIAAELLESYRLVPVSETSKQSPRWVKYSTRKPEKPGWHHVEAFYGEGAGHYHYFNGSDFESQNKPLIPVEHSKWLDESGSPEPEAVDPDFTLWVVVNKWQYHEGKHRWLNDYIAECNGMRLTHEELYNLFKQTK